LNARVTVGRGKRKQSSQIEIKANYETPGSRDRRHFAEGVNRANEVAEEQSTMDQIEMIARQASIICVGIYKMNIAVTIGLGIGPRERELISTDVDCSYFAILTDPASEPSRGVASATADVCDSSTARDTNLGHDPRRVWSIDRVEERKS
jgi:hypothetical protein